MYFLANTYYLFRNVPVVHAAVLQDFSCDESPGHPAPPFAGVGLVHERILYVIPDPHVREHVCHFPHDVQLPSTADNKNIAHVSPALYVTRQIAILFSLNIFKLDNDI